eukprot:PLAT9956.1.p1 GENE.PLAT9956.1~~PLAT9956.1.p1  ORF type:complete len:349 (-),score=151.13 PLAT9956.1:68-1093(-)
MAAAASLAAIAADGAFVAYGERVLHALHAAWEGGDLPAVSSALTQLVSECAAVEAAAELSAAASAFLVAASGEEMDVHGCQEAYGQLVAAFQLLAGSVGLAAACEAEAELLERAESAGERAAAALADAAHAAALAAAAAEEEGGLDAAVDAANELAEHARRCGLPRITLCADTLWQAAQDGDYATCAAVAAVLPVVADGCVAAVAGGGAGGAGGAGAAGGGGGKHDEAIELDAAQLEQLAALEAAQPGFMARAIDLFSTDGDKHVSELLRCLSEGDVEGSCSHAHALKGSASNVGATALSATCAQFRIAVESDDWAEAARLAESAQQMFVSVCVHLRSLLH